LDALIAKFQNAVQNNSGGQNQRAFNDVFMQQVEAAEARINQIVGQRSQLIDLENLKVQMGLQTQRTAQQEIEKHFAETQPLIQQHIDQIEALARAYSGALTPEMQAYFDALRARIAGVTLESQGTNASFIGLKNSIDQILTSNIVGFVDSNCTIVRQARDRQGRRHGLLRVHRPRAPEDDRQYPSDGGDAHHRSPDPRCR
jgi:hypothetical protein